MDQCERKTFRLMPHFRPLLIVTGLDLSDASCCLTEYVRSNKCCRVIYLLASLFFFLFFLTHWILVTFPFNGTPMIRWRRMPRRWRTGRGWGSSRRTSYIISSTGILTAPFSNRSMVPRAIFLENFHRFISVSVKSDKNPSIWIN